jgi:flagellar hook assembly protein FlgD
MASMPSPVTSGSQPSTGTSSSSSSLSSASAQAAQVTEQQFLQLLVAQLKNQDPRTPGSTSNGTGSTPGSKTP